MEMCWGFCRVFFLLSGRASSAVPASSWGWWNAETLWHQIPCWQSDSHIEGVLPLPHTHTNTYTYCYYTNYVIRIHHVHPLKLICPYARKRHLSHNRWAKKCMCCCGNLHLMTTMWHTHFSCYIQRSVKIIEWLISTRKVTVCSHRQTSPFAKGKSCTGS